MITTEQELHHAYESIAKLYVLRDRLVADRSGDPQDRTPNRRAFRSSPGTNDDRGMK